MRPLCSFTSQEASKFETTGHHFQNPKTYPSGRGPGGPLQSLLGSVWTEPVSSWVDSQIWTEDRSCWALRPVFPRPESQVKPPVPSADWSQQGAVGLHAQHLGISAGVRWLGLA